MAKILRFENSEDIVDHEISDELAAKITEANTDDLFRDAHELWKSVTASPQLPFDEGRKFDFSFVMY